MIFRRKKNTVSGFTDMRRRPVSRFIKKAGRTRIETPQKSARKFTRQRLSLQRLKRICLVLTTGIVLIWITNQFFLSDRLAVKNIQVVEDEKLNNDHALYGILKDLKGSNLLFVKSGTIEKTLREQYLEYEFIRVEKHFPSTLTIVLKKYPAIANLILENTKTEKTTPYLINIIGILMSGKKQPELPELRIRIEQNKNTGSKVISQERLGFSLEAIQAFEDKFGMIVPYGLYMETEREFHLWTEREFWVWLDMLKPLDEQLNKLKQALPKVNIYEESLEYIDLRISGINGEKVIFKRS